MAELTDPRLIKVRVVATAGHGGARAAGWAVGTRGVLTARHVVAGIIDGEASCVAVPDPKLGSDTFDCSLEWDDPVRDLALLIIGEQQHKRWASMVGADPGPVLAEPGTSIVAVQAIGYPDATLNDGFPVPEQTSGVLRPAAAAVTGSIPYDLDGSVPGDSLAWQGMSGAAVRELSSGRVLGVITDTAKDRQLRRLYVSPLPDPKLNPRFADALTAAGAPPTLEAMDAPRMRRLLAVWDDTGRPSTAGEISNLELLGVRKARRDIDTQGDPYYPYITRTLDAELRAGLDARAAGSDNRVLLLMGDAMSGKSRTGANAVITHPILSRRALLVPQAMADLVDVAELTPPQGAVLWLDDVNTFQAGLNPGVVRVLLTHPGLVVVATLRSELLSTFLSPELRPVWAVLDDAALVEQFSVPAVWSQQDQELLANVEPVIRRKVAEGYSLGEVLGAADELRHRLATAEQFIRRAVAYTVIDWARMGLTGGIPEDQVQELWLHYLSMKEMLVATNKTADQREADYREALQWVCEPIPHTATMLVTRDQGLLRPDDYLVAHPGTSDATIPDNLWVTAFTRVRSNETTATLATLGYNAFLANRLDVARAAWIQAATDREFEGASSAAFNLGYLFAVRLDPPDLAGARRWYQKAADAGHTGAAFNLGLLLANRLDPPDLDGARRWYQKAADAGDTTAAFNLGHFLEDRLDPPDLDGARRWYQKAADAGHTTAMNNLGVLLVNWLDPPDLDRARRWYQKAADAGHLLAMNNLGNLLAKRLDPPDLDGAHRWYQKAADAGHTTAMLNLGYLLAKRLDPPNLDGARRWYQKAADAGHTTAMNNLGYLLANRLDPPDLDGARLWYQKAADAGHTTAMNNLGLLQSERLDTQLGPIRPE